MLVLFDLENILLDTKSHEAEHTEIYQDSKHLVARSAFVRGLTRSMYLNPIIVAHKLFRDGDTVGVITGFPFGTHLHLLNMDTPTWDLFSLWYEHNSTENRLILLGELSDILLPDMPKIYVTTTMTSTYLPIIDWTIVQYNGQHTNELYNEITLMGKDIADEWQ